MSRTQIKHYRAVWESACRVAAAKEGVWNGTALVGEVMKDSGLSRPTVIKYMKQGVKDGYFDAYGMGERYPVLYKVLITE